MVSAMVGFNIPLWYKSKQERKVAESQKDIQARKDQLAAMTNEIRFHGQRKVDGDRKGGEADGASENGDHSPGHFCPGFGHSSYRVNKVDFITLLDSLMTLFKYEIQYYRLLADHGKIIAEIEAAVGRSLRGGEKGMRRIVGRHVFGHPASFLSACSEQREKIADLFRWGENAAEA